MARGGLAVTSPKRAHGSLRARLGAGILRRLELPPDVLIDLPRLTLVGNLQLTVENHKGLTQFAPNVLGIATRTGRIHIHGDELEIANIGADEIRVLGRIASLRFDPPPGKAAPR